VVERQFEGVERQLEVLKRRFGPFRLNLITGHHSTFAKANSVQLLHQLFSRSPGRYVVAGLSRFLKS